mgnify:CR=1 FL=1
MQATLGNTRISAGNGKKVLRFLLDWAAIITLALCFIIFTLIKGSSFMSENNMIVWHRGYGNHGSGRL